MHRSYVQCVAGDKRVKDEDTSRRRETAPPTGEEAGPIRTMAPFTVYLTTVPKGPIVGLQPRELTRNGYLPKPGGPTILGTVRSVGWVRSLPLVSVMRVIVPLVEDVAKAVRKASSIGRMPVRQSVSHRLETVRASIVLTGG